MIAQPNSECYQMILNRAGEMTTFRNRYECERSASSAAWKQDTEKLSEQSQKLLACIEAERSSTSSLVQTALQDIQTCRLLKYEDAPAYLKYNPYILSGYRGLLNTKLCIESIFWWTNETINIWSHVFGLFLFTGLAINDVVIINIDAPFGDKVIVTFILFCFQVCMFLSALYHTFSCRSEPDYHNFLAFDLFGIALALYAVYISGIYYAYWCDQEWGNFYMLSVTLIFIVAMIIQVPRFHVDANVKMAVFVAWALYGVVPTCHWHALMGGFKNPLVQVLLPRVLGMYMISGTAFLIYLTKVPERFFPGSVDYVGHSHQWWHLFILLALYYWHNSGMIYVQYRMNHACLQNINIL